ncbi:cation:proton antiporter [Okeanomitos corallinicola TIOX110]|uniref:Cation:proton antiporter n=1 Tax=Okeanomitos corallinicola TIOX110 TaxID=3133117 RepID=A0ABZ2USC2_9CYAN
MIGSLILRLTIWFLLTSDLSITNIIIGVIIAIVLPRGRTSKEKLKEWLRVIIKIVAAVPIAFKEALEIMLFPHHHEEIIMERVKPKRSLHLIFLDIFLITFTPKTIVLKYHEEGWYEVHEIRRRKNKNELRNSHDGNDISLTNTHL